MGSLDHTRSQGAREERLSISFLFISFHFISSFFICLQVVAGQKRRFNELLTELKQPGWLSRGLVVVSSIDRWRLE